MRAVLASPLGFLIGLALGALGGGGSIVAVPVLVYVAGQEPAAATTTSLLVVGTAAAVGMVGHARAGRVRFGAGVVVGHCVTEPSVNGEPAGRGVGDKLIEHGRREIDSRHTVTEGCRGQSNVTRTSRYIEDIAGRVRKHRGKRINPSLVLHRAVLGHIAGVRLVVGRNRAPEAGDRSLDVVGIDHLTHSPIPADGSRRNRLRPKAKQNDARPLVHTGASMPQRERSCMHRDCLRAQESLALPDAV